jgi:hypothetical protein
MHQPMLHDRPQRFSKSSLFSFPKLDTVGTECLSCEYRHVNRVDYFCLKGVLCCVTIGCLSHFLPLAAANRTGKVHFPKTPSIAP